MSVRQYIGARYVTKIYENSSDPSSAEWEASVNYEPLTMVTYNNGSYLSKKEVPASVGDPASNPTYWVQTGFYNGQIASLQDQIDKLAAPRYFIFQGDSYTNDWDYTWPTWPEIIVNNLGLTSDDFEVLNNDSAGFADAGMQGTFQQQLEAATFAKTPTDIVIAAGANERGHSYSDIYDAVKAYCAKAHELYPDARVWISMISYSTTNTIQFELTDKIFTAYKKGTIESDAIWLENPCFSLTLGKEMDDALHPNADGQKYIGDALSSALINGTDVITKFDTLTFTPDAAFTIEGTTRLYYQQLGDITNVRLQNSSRIPATKLSCSPMATYGTWMKIGTFDTSILNAGDIQWHGTVVVKENNNYALDSCLFRIEMNELYISFTLGQLSLTELYIPSVDVTCPTRSVHH